MKKLRCLIVDDEYMARLLLENYCHKLPHLEIVGICENALEALALLRHQRIDIVLLDIQMPHLTGLELVHTLPQKPAIIFSTAYAEHAVDGFNIDAVDYLLKPYSFERFVQAINKASLYLSHQVTPTAIAEPLPETSNNDHLFMKADGKLVKVRYEEILYIEGLKEYVTVYTETSKIVSLQSLRNLENILPRTQFLRIHKSYIVAVPKIQALYGNQVEIKQTAIPIGSSYKEQLWQLLGLEE